MLNAIRQKTATWVVRILAVLLIISFAAWGIEDIFRGRASEEVVATVGDSRITANELSTEFRAQTNRLRGALGGTADTARAKELGILDRTLEIMVQGRLYGREADVLGLQVGDATVRAAILGEQAFLNEAGQFDRLRYEQGLRELGHSEASFVATVRQELRRRQITTAVTGGAVAPDPLVDAIWRYRNEHRVAELINVPRASVKDVAAPTDAEIEAYYNDNKSRFMAPEYRAVTVVVLDPRTLAREIKPSEEQGVVEYEIQLPSLRVPERRDLMQIVAADEAAAQKAAAALAEGKDFTTVATEVAGMDSGAADLGSVTREELPPPLGETAFSLQAGETSKPVQSPLGWHILRVGQVFPGHEPALAEVREQIARDVALHMATDRLVAATNRLDDALAGGTSLADAAQEIGAEVKTVPAIDRQGRTPDGDIVEGVPRDTAFTETAFSLEAGATSLINELPDGGAFVVRADKVVPPAPRPLAEVRDQVVAAIEMERRDAAARQQAEAILEKVRGGVPLAEAAKAAGLTLSKTPSFTRSGEAGAEFVPAAVAAALFEVNQGDAAIAPYDDGYAVAVLTAVHPADATRDAEGRRLVREQLVSTIAGDLLAQYSAALRKEYPVTVDRSAVDALF